MSATPPIASPLCECKSGLALSPVNSHGIKTANRYLNKRPVLGADILAANDWFVGEISYIVLETRSMDVDHSVLTRELTGALQDAPQSA